MPVCNGSYNSRETVTYSEFSRLKDSHPMFISLGKRHWSVIKSLIRLHAGISTRQAVYYHACNPDPATINSVHEGSSTNRPSPDHPVDLLMLRIFSQPFRYHQSTLVADYIVDEADICRRCVMIATPTLTLHSTELIDSPSCLT